jgi:hypothetical protein
MLMSNARNLAKDLGLWIGPGNTIWESVRLQAAFNNWLFNNKKLHIMAASVTYPRGLDGDGGVTRMFISTVVHGGAEEESLMEDEKALEVKREIEAESGVKFAASVGITPR